LPGGPPFEGPFDVIVAKDVVEHLTEPARWARVLVDRLATGGDLVLSTPNYGRGSTLDVLERTVLEAVARRDGYSRRHIHPSRFDAGLLGALDLGSGVRLVEVVTTWNRWALVGRWRRS
jgi:SAM-dependent methyltransferase